MTARHGPRHGPRATGLRLHLHLHLHLRRATGFTLVEMAMVLVVGGLLLAMTAKGFAVLASSKADQLIQQVRHFDMLLSEHARTHQRWPGDCDGNGLIDVSLADSTAPTPGDLAADRAARAERYDYTASLPYAVSDASGDAPAAPGNACPAQLGSARLAGALAGSFAADLNVPFNDLKLAGLLSPAQPNRIAAAHAGGDFVSLVQLHLNPSSQGIDRDFNALVLFNVPLSFARRLAIAIDGFEGEAPYKGRVRRLDIATSVSNVRFNSAWQEAGESPDALVSVAYFFDQLPLPQSYQTY